MTAHTVILPQSRSFTVLSPNDPALIPLADYRLAGASTLPSGLTYTRPSQAWDYGFQVYGNDVPRLVALGLLYEETGTNPITDSQNINPDNTDWLKFSTAVVAQNATVAPDGSMTAERFGCVDTGGSNSVALRQDVAIASGADHTASVYAKADQTNWIAIQWRDYDDTATAYFDLGAGTVGAVAPAVVSTSIESVGSGWYRISVTYRSITDLAGNVRLYLAAGNSDLILNMDGLSSVFVWQADVKQGPAGTPIVTGDAAVTRAADLLSINLADGAYDVLVERADLDGAIAKTFVDVTAAGAGWNVPIDMTRPYVSRLRPWPAGRLTAAQKAFLTA